MKLFSNRWLIALFLAAAPAVRAQDIQLEVEKLTQPGGAAFDYFGHSLALSGDALVVGAHGAPGAWLFRRASSSWQLAGQLPASGGNYGIAVAFDGQRLLVGDDLADAPTQQLVGAAYVYALRDLLWSPEAVLRPADGAIHDHFGAALAIDGELAVVGSPEHLHGDEWGAGYVYRRGAHGWALEQELDARSRSVAIHLGTIVCGSPGLTSTSQGRVHVYVHDGAQWIEASVLSPDDGTDGDRFGTAVALHDDTLVVGADNARLQGVDTGAVYVYERTDGSWSQVAKLVPTGAKSGDAFGTAVACDGVTLVAGATGRDEALTNTGAAWRYARGPGGWAQRALFVASDATAHSFLGRSVALERATVLLGADFADGSAADAGAVYAYDIGLGEAYCFGDGTGTPCPCGNPGGPDEGCANSTGVGASMVATGSTSVGADELVFHARGLVPLQPALLFSALQRTSAGAGAPFGDGLRCAGGEARRLGLRLPDSEGEARWGPGLAPQGGWAPGDTRRFQLHYRDPLGGPCGTGFNLSHGLELAFGS